MTTSSRLAFLVIGCIALTALLEANRYANSNPPAQQPAVQAVVPYNASVYGGPPGLTPEQGKRLIALLESMDGKLDLLASIDEKLAGGGVSVKTAPKLTWSQVVTAKCASCHNSKDPKGDFILVNEDKTPKPLNTREWTKVIEAVESGHMPPPDKGKLTPAEKAAFKK